MSGIEFLPEWLNADAAIGVEEALAGRARFEIGVDDGLDRIGDFVLAERGADDVADRGGLVARAAERDLVEFDALLIDAENADMADMVMAAGVDAAGNLDLELADRAAGARDRRSACEIACAIGIERALARSQ